LIALWPLWRVFSAYLRTPIPFLRNDFDAERISESTVSNNLLSFPTGTRTRSSVDLDTALGVHLRQGIGVGTRIGNYRTESYLGRGGMASVYEATDLRLNRPVALKVLVAELAENSDFRVRFVRESRFAASLEHPNIVPIYDAGESDGLLYIAMRLVRGTDLAGFLGAAGPLEPTAAMDLLAPAASALDAAHAAGLIHRDVKPANFLLATGRDGHQHVYLADFGLTKRASALAQLTVSGTFVGTMEYSSPEQIRGEKLDSRSDLYALGCVAYQCLTGSPPFVRNDEAALLWAHLAVDPAPVSAHCPNLAGADAVIARCLAKSPENRFDSCGQFIDALADAACTGRHRSASARLALEPGPVTHRPAWDEATQPGSRPTPSTRDLRVSQDRKNDGAPSHPPTPVPESLHPPASPPWPETPPALPITPNGRRIRRVTRPIRRHGVVVSIGALLAISTLLAALAVALHDRSVANPDRSKVGAASPATAPLSATPQPAANPTSPVEPQPPARALAIPSTLESPIAVGPTPGFVTVSADGRHAYVAHGEAGFLTVVDTVTDQVSGRIPMRSGPPQHIAVTPDGSRAFVSVFDAQQTVNAVAVLDTRTSQVLLTIPVEQQPMALTIGPDQRYVYVPGRGAVDVLDATTGRTIAEVAVPGDPYSIRISPGGAWGYIAVPDRNQVSVVDTADYRIGPPIGVGASPRGMALSPDGKLLAVACFGSNEVYVIDSATRQVVQTATVGTGPMDVAFTPDGRYVYTADVDSGTVTVVDPESGAVTASIPTPSPTSVSFLPDGTRAYVTNRDSGTVTVLHAAS